MKDDLSGLSGNYGSGDLGDVMKLSYRGDPAKDLNVRFELMVGVWTEFSTFKVYLFVFESVSSKLLRRSLITLLSWSFTGIESLSDRFEFSISSGLEIPKSHNSTLQSFLISILDGLRSRCIRPVECRKFKAHSIL